jgi:hypothetical protein
LSAGNPNDFAQTYISWTNMATDFAHTLILWIGTPNNFAQTDLFYLSTLSPLATATPHRVIYHPDMLQSLHQLLNPSVAKYPLQQSGTGD